MISLIPPLLVNLVNSSPNSDFKAKASLSNTFFESRCSPLENNSIITNSQVFFTDTKFNSVKFNNNDILKVIINLDTNKAHGYDSISFLITKLCDSAIVKSFLMMHKK